MRVNTKVCEDDYGMRVTMKNDHTMTHSVQKKTELLAPAGNRQAFLAALQAGADAVYLGGDKFGARAYADNFTQEELIRTIKDAHIFGKRIYLTVNILAREEELPEIVEFVRPFYENGLDGVIVQDLGVIRALGENFPGLELHASTQLSVTSPESARFLKQLGVCRVVPAREMSLEEMENIKEAENIEIEAFIHGAMCYSYSGRCLMSSFLGGRSGNRGRCAGTCRLPYKILDENKKPAGKDGDKVYYPLSMRDMCVLSILPDLLDAGLDSFKIEGRMKRPEYAAGVTAIYRKYIDKYYELVQSGKKELWSIDPEDMEVLQSLYLRTEISNGYYHRRNGRGMVTIDKPGYAGTEESLLQAIAKKYPSELPKREIFGNCYLAAGQPAFLSVYTEDGFSASVEGEIVQAAQNRPLSGEEIRRRLQKTGESVFAFKELTVETDGDVFMPASQINALRREVLAELEEQILTAYDTENRERAIRITREMAESVREYSARPDRTEKAESSGNELMALVITQEQFDSAASSGVKHIIIEYDTKISQNFNGGNYCIYYALPYIYRTEDKSKVMKILQQGSSCTQFAGVFVRTPEELQLADECRKNSIFSGEILADASLYRWNRESASLIGSYADRSVLPLELNGKELSASFGRESSGNILMLYGRIPMMISANCVRKTEKCCTGGRTLSHGEDFWYLRDRKNVDFPVRCVCGSCQNVIYNSVPLSLHQALRKDEKSRIHELSERGLLSFTTETGKETENIIRYFKKIYEQTADVKKNARAKDGSDFQTPPFKDFTNGHFKNGAL